MEWIHLTSSYFNIQKIIIQVVMTNTSGEKGD